MSYVKPNYTEAEEEAIEQANEPCPSQAAVNSYLNADGAIPATQPKLDSDVGRK